MIVNQQHRFASRIEQRPFACFAASQLGRFAIAVGDIPEDHLNADDLILVVVFRRLKNLHPTGFAIGGRMRFDMIHRFARPQNPLIIQSIRIGQCRRIKVRIGTADHLADRSTDATTKRIVRIRDHAFDIFANHLQLHPLGQGLQVRFGPVQTLLSRLATSDFAPQRLVDSSHLKRPTPDTSLQLFADQQPTFAASLAVVVIVNRSQ